MTEIEPAFIDRIEQEYATIKSIADAKGLTELDQEGIPQESFWKEVSNVENIGEAILRITIGYTGSDLERGFKNLFFKSIGSTITYEKLREALKSVGGTLEKEQIYARTKHRS